MQQPRVAAGVPNKGGQFASPGRAETTLNLGASAAEVGPYSDWTPEEIDTKLNDAWGRLSRVEHRIKSGRVAADRARESLQGRGLSEDQIQDRVAIYEPSAQVLEEHTELADELAGYGAEFMTRGGWPRGWYVAGGHVHRDRSCSTLRVTTQISLLPQLSGMTENEIVDQAGEAACTCCYPDAPVEVLSRSPKVALPDREEVEKARLERDEKRRGKEAKAAANTLTWAAQEPVEDFGQPIVSVRDAQSALRSAVFYGAKGMPINIAAAGREVVQATILLQQSDLSAESLANTIDRAWTHARNAHALHSELIAKRIELGEDPDSARTTVDKQLSTAYKREFGTAYAPETIDGHEIARRQEWARGVLERWAH
ncbi:MAG: hypothetical protein M3Y35_02515 [Actinomycetota bacterium]|nr:hypothetical protein [Actinomycetota bacterium]